MSASAKNIAARSEIPGRKELSHGTRFGGYGQRIGFVTYDVKILSVNNDAIVRG